ncbi:MAG: putative repeat protein (TIGR03833 family) [Limisphaerales bacterium]|jgi:uncharacterized repeat protein (TIGR03833 family)
MDGQKRRYIQVGQTVQVVQKQDQKTGLLTEGTVKRILTKVQMHPHGIKVMLKSGKVGRVKNIIKPEEIV